jgi:hypothetical protein
MPSEDIASSEIRLTVRLVAKGAAAQLSDPGAIREICTSRTGVSRQESSLGTLSEELKQVLFDSEPQVLQWLAASRDHLEAFIRDPINSLVQAGVDLDRSQQKELLRERNGQLAPETRLSGLPEPILSFEVDPTPPRRTQHRDKSLKDNPQDASQKGE